MKLKTLILLVFISITLVASIGGSYYFYLQSSGVLEDHIYMHLETAAQSRANHINDFLDLTKERFNLIASRTQLRISLNNYNQNPNHSR